MTQKALMLRVHCVTASDRRGNCLASPFLDFPLLGALNTPGLRDHEVHLAARLPLVHPSLVF